MSNFYKILFLKISIIIMRKNVCTHRLLANTIDDRKQCILCYHLDLKARRNCESRSRRDCDQDFQALLEGNLNRCNFRFGYQQSNKIQLLNFCTPNYVLKNFSTENRDDENKNNKKVLKKNIFFASTKSCWIHNIIFLPFIYLLGIVNMCQKSFALHVQWFGNLTEIILRGR